MTTTCAPESIGSTTLLLAFELGKRTWKLGFSTGLGQRPRVREVPAGATDRVLDEISRAKRRLKVSANAPVVSCYEAGRDGFWIHRWLTAHGLTNHVIDSSSIEVKRRARHVKTDRLDLAALVNLLARYVLGDRQVWRVVHVPTVVDEDARQLQRTWETLQHDRTRLLARLEGLLVTQGLRVRITKKFLAHLEATRLWDGAGVPAGLHARLTQVWTQLELVTTQLTQLERTRAARRPDLTPVTRCYVERLPTLCGVGPVGAWVLATELFGWRQIQNARQLGALVGLVPAPYQSGMTAHDHGITRAGNKHVRPLMLQLAWQWVRYQPTSALTRWFHQRFGDGGRRIRRIGIVALARKLLIALWRYVDQGVIPEGARLKPQTA